MLLDAPSPEPSPAPQDRKAASAPDAPPSDRDAAPAPAAHSDQTDESHDSKASDGKDGDAAPQDTEASGDAHHATEADSDASAPADGKSDQTATDDGTADGATPQVDQNANVVLCQIGVTIPVTGAAAPETTQTPPDCVTGDAKGQTPVPVVTKFVGTNAKAEEIAQGEAPGPTDPKEAACESAAVPPAAAAVDSPDSPPDGGSPTNGPSTDDTTASIPTAFAKAAGLLVATGPASQSSGPKAKQPDAPGLSPDKGGGSGDSAPAEIVAAEAAGQSATAIVDPKDGLGPKGTAAPKKSAQPQPDDPKGQAKFELAKNITVAADSAPTDNATTAAAGAHGQSKHGTAKTESETDSQPTHRFAGPHPSGIDAAPSPTIRPNAPVLPAGTDNLPASAGAIIANQSAPSAPTPAVPSPLAFATPNAIPLAALPVEIATQAKAGNNRFDIRLDPPELGRIDVRLDIDTKGNVTSRLMVERPETLDLLRRDAPQLERALQDAGLKTSDQSLQFSLRDQSFTRGDRLPSTATYLVPDDDGSASTIIQQGYGQRVGLGAGIDIRV